MSVLVLSHKETVFCHGWGNVINHCAIKSRDMGINVSGAFFCAREAADMNQQRRLTQDQPQDRLAC